MNDQKTKIGLFDFTMIVVSLVIGMGIFRTATDSAKESLTPAIYFTAWIVGGIVALCGALTYAEIGSRLPVTGGYYKIFSYAYHPSIAFAINCIILISNAASLAVVALIGAGYLQLAFFPDAGNSFKTIIAIVSVALFYGINLLGLKMSARAQTLLMLFKISLLIFLASGLFFAKQNAVNPPFLGNGNSSFSNIILSFGAAMVAVSFTYGGYQQTINFGNEVSNPMRNIPKGIFVGIAIIIAIYLLVNTSYYKVVGFNWMQNRPEGGEVGFELAKNMVGVKGATIFSGLLFFGVLTYVNALLLSNPRVMYAMSQDGVLPKSFAKTTPKKGVLFVSLTVFTLLCIVVLFNSSKIDELLSFSIFLDCFGMILSAATIFTLRKKTKDLNDKGIYQVKYYPLIPIVFIVAYIFVAISIFITKTKLAYIAIAVFSFFMLLYLIMQTLKEQNNK
jgi:basic amino acid/polyamine antiporter, APA family